MAVVRLPAAARLALTVALLAVFWRGAGALQTVETTATFADGEVVLSGTAASWTRRDWGEEVIVGTSCDGDQLSDSSTHSDSAVLLRFNVTGATFDQAAPQSARLTVSVRRLSEAADHLDVYAPEPDWDTSAPPVTCCDAHKHITTHSLARLPAGGDAERIDVDVTPALQAWRAAGAGAPRIDLFVVSSGRDCGSLAGLGTFAARTRATRPALAVKQHLVAEPPDVASLIVLGPRWRSAAHDGQSVEVSVGLEREHVGRVGLECSLDGVRFDACTVSARAANVIELPPLPEGAHTVHVRTVASNGRGFVRRSDGPPARAAILVDRTPPVLSIEPRGTSARPGSHTFAFIADDAGGHGASGVLRVRCALDQEPMRPCPPVVSLERLKQGTHVVRAQAEDAAGNAGPEIRHEFAVDAAPEMTCSFPSHPEGRSNGAVRVRLTRPGRTDAFSRDAVAASLFPPGRAAHALAVANFTGPLPGSVFEFHINPPDGLPAGTITVSAATTTAGDSFAEVCSVDYNPFPPECTIQRWPAAAQVGAAVPFEVQFARVQPHFHPSHLRAYVDSGRSAAPGGRARVEPAGWPSRATAGRSVSYSALVHLDVMGEVFVEVPEGVFMDEYGNANRRCRSPVLRVWEPVAALAFAGGDVRVFAGEGYSRELSAGADSGRGEDGRGAAEHVAVGPGGRIARALPGSGLVVVSPLGEPITAATGVERALAFRADGHVIGAASDPGGDGYTIMVLDGATGAMVHRAGPDLHRMTPPGGSASEAAAPAPRWACGERTHVIRLGPPCGVEEDDDALGELASGRADDDADDARLCGPRAATVDGRDQVFVVDACLRGVLVLGAQLEPRALLTGWNTTGQFSKAEGVAVDGAGRLYVLDEALVRVLDIVSDELSFLGTIGRDDASPGTRIGHARALAVDHAGSLLVLAGAEVLRFDPQPGPRDAARWVPAGRAMAVRTDLGNAVGLAVFRDAAVPRVTITLADGDADRSAPFGIVIDWEGPLVSGFGADGVVVGGVGGTVTDLRSSDGRRYTATVRPSSVGGAVVFVKARAAWAANGAANAAPSNVLRVRYHGGSCVAENVCEWSLALYQHELALDRDRRAARLRQEAAARAEALNAAGRLEAERAAVQVRVEAERELERVRLEGETARLAAAAAAAGERARAEALATEDVRLRLAQEEGRQRALAMRGAVVSVVQEATRVVRELADSPRDLAGLTGFLGVCLGVFFVLREATRVVGHVVQLHLTQPPLVRETTMTWSAWLLGPLRRALDAVGSAAPANKALSDVVLEGALHERMEQLALSIANARARRAPFRHVLLWGPPGTGKTMAATRLARGCGLDYAILSGGDVLPLGSAAAAELNRVFDWASRSSRGLLLFVDEADAFLRRRGAAHTADHGPSESLRAAINVVLSRTGGQQGSFLLVLASNRPGDLDDAVLDRMDDTVEFPKPGLEQRVQMLKMYFAEYIGAFCEGPKPGTVRRGPLGMWSTSVEPWSLAFPPGRSDVVRLSGFSAEAFRAAARLTEGFSGREMVKVMAAVQAEVYAGRGGSAARAKDAAAAEAAGALFLDADTMLRVVKAKVGEHVTREAFLEAAATEAAAPLSSPRAGDDAQPRAHPNGGAQR
ncbi:unnamed protein product [Pedinophyceae sp. YPF-701]|nr:unnamed protein product [Pedinophyceae sp. YPF-701]